MQTGTWECHNPASPDRRGGVEHGMAVANQQGVSRLVGNVLDIGSTSRGWSIDRRRTENGAVTTESAGEPRSPDALPERYVADFLPRLGGSAAMCTVRGMVENIAITDAAVLLRGESGVGKDLVARAIHAASKRSDGPFIKVNCAAIPHGLLESELFGHEKGAFTGAHRRRPGHFEYANKGTIYLDEIGELPMSLQAKVLHVLQDLTFSRVGGEGMIEVDVRIIAATNRDLEQAIAHREFREDLYYRLNVVEICIPPLRERTEEILPVARRFLDLFNKQYGRSRELTPEIERCLLAYRWPGNGCEPTGGVARHRPPRCPAGGAQGACRGSRTGELEPSRGRPRAEGQLQDAAQQDHRVRVEAPDRLLAALPPSR